MGIKNFNTRGLQMAPPAKRQKLESMFESKIANLDDTLGSPASKVDNSLNDSLILNLLQLTRKTVEDVGGALQKKGPGGDKKQVKPLEGLLRTTPESDMHTGGPSLELPPICTPLWNVLENRV